MSDELKDGRSTDAALEEWLAYSDEPEKLNESRVDVLSVVSVALAVVVLIGIILLRPTGESQGQSEQLTALGVPSQFHAAEIVAIENIPCAGAPNDTCQRVAFELIAGPDPGYVYHQDFTPGKLTPEFNVGRSVVLSYVTPPGKIDEIQSEPCDFDSDLTCTTLTIFLGEGAEMRRTEFQISPSETDTIFSPKEPVLVNLFEGPDDELEIVSISRVDPSLQYQFSDFQRRGSLFWLALVFALLVVALGRLRGIFALAGLAASVIVLLQFVLPAILDGRSPVLVAVFGAASIAYLALYLAHGFTRMTTVALLGTLAALALTALLSTVVVETAHFTGLATEESALLTLFDRIDVRGLLLAGIVLGAVGAIDDVTVTQASAVWELRDANPAFGVRQLARSGLRIGRDHISSTVNTLLLAYAGASLPLLVLFVLSSQSLGTVANAEVVAVEIIRTLVGSIGLVAAVPFTTWLAAYAVHRGSK